MSEYYVDSYQSEELLTKADKARGAAALGRHLFEVQGMTHSAAGDFAAHELKHAIADSGPGQFEFGYELDESNRILEKHAAYQPLGPRTDEQMIAILDAPVDKSQYDLEQLDRLQKPWWKKLLDLLPIGKR